MRIGPQQRRTRRRRGVFVVLREPYEPFEETDDVTRIAYEVMDETDWDLHVIPHHDSVAGRRAERVEKKGIEL